MKSGEGRIWPGDLEEMVARTRAPPDSGEDWFDTGGSKNRQRICPASAGGTAVGEEMTRF